MRTLSLCKDMLRQEIRMKWNYLLADNYLREYLIYVNKLW